MKSLTRILGLTFLALTLTNCSGKLPPEDIASRLEPSIVKVFYKNQPGHGTGFFVSGEKGVCTVLTAAHVVKKEGERLLQTRDEKVWQVARVEIFPSDIDLALVTFQPEGEKCNFPALKIGSSESLRKGSSIYISGFPIRGGKLVSQFVSGDVSGLDRLARGYGVAYQALTVGGMSGAPVADVKGEVVAVHGMNDVEVVKNFASYQASLSESERQTFQQAVERVETGVQRLTFSWGIPINLFEEYRGEADRKIAIALGKEKQKEKLQRQLEKEQRKLEETEQRVRELEVELLELDYAKLRDLLAAGKWKEADKETERVMLKVAGRESEGWFGGDDVKNFSCQDLGTIDKLWVKYSSDKFGFSVQKQIYQSLGSKIEYDLEVWSTFKDKVGWISRGVWLRYSSPPYDYDITNSTPLGHLPVPLAIKLRRRNEGDSDWEGRQEGVTVLLSRAETCGL